MSKQYLIRLAITGVISAILLAGCVTNSRPGCNPNAPCLPASPEIPHEKLSDYNLFTGKISDLNPVEGLIPYDLNTPLFSDYAQKFRLVYLPEHNPAHYMQDGDGAIEFPAGSILVKNFYYGRDLRDPSLGRRLVETRLLIRWNSGWTAQAYVWNEQQTEAYYQPAGNEKVINWIDQEGAQREVRYVIPSKNDCKTCHSRSGHIVPLGPKIRNLNKEYFYATGLKNQLIKWQEAGFLIGLPAPGQMVRTPVWDDSLNWTTKQRARAYLDVNCSHCHNREGSANNSALFLTYSEKDLSHLGICKSPVAAGAGSGNFKYDIVPGKPEESILIFRMESEKPQERMPELGRTLIHKGAVKLIKKWIRNMNQSPCEEGQLVKHSRK